MKFRQARKVGIGSILFAILILIGLLFWYLLSKEVLTGKNKTKKISSSSAKTATQESPPLQGGQSKGVIQNQNLTKAPQEQIKKLDPIFSFSFESSFIDSLKGKKPLVQAGKFVPAKNGKGLAIDSGELSYEANLVKPGEGTIEFWFKPDWNGNDKQDYILLFAGKGDSFAANADDDTNALNLMKTFNNNLEFQLSAGEDKSTVFTSVADWKAGEWHHIGLTYSIEELRIAIYLDGKLADDTVKPKAEQFISYSYLSFGSKHGEFAAKGIFDELNIFWEAKSKKQMTI